MRRICFLFFVLICFFGCKKTELEVITGNTPPPDGSLPVVTIENYINRTYILVLGRGSGELEFNLAKIRLSDSHLDSTSRRAFLSSVFASPDYLPHLYNENRIDLLNNVDTAEITGWLFLFQYYLQDTTFMLQWPVLEYESDRLTILRDSYNQFVSGNISVAQLKSRMCDNYLYDQINMGSANFVIATFQNLINRNPTNSEQQSGIAMVDGSNAIVFLQAGSSKNDYLDILTHCTNYYEAQVVSMYVKYLQRMPTTIEMAEGTLIYSSTGDYTEAQKIILSTDEFIGLL